MSAAAVQPKRPSAGKQLEWVNPPQQARSQQTLDRLLDAAEALIEERGFEEISVAEITRKARSSVGAFYSRFKDKQGLLRYVQQRFSEQAAATAEVALSPDRWAGMSVYEICHDLVEFLVRLYGERGGLLLTFHFHVRSDPEIADRLVANNERIVEMLTRLLMERRDEITHPAPQTAVSFSVAMVFGALHEWALFSSARPQTQSISTTEMVHELTRAFVSYLGAKLPDQP